MSTLEVWTLPVEESCSVWIRVPRTKKKLTWKATTEIFWIERTLWNLLCCLQEKRGERPPLKRAKQKSDSESGRESESEREKDGSLAFNQLGHKTLVEGRNNFCCKGKFIMFSVFVVAIVAENIPVYRWVWVVVVVGGGGGGGRGL